MRCQPTPRRPPAAACAFETIGHHRLRTPSPSGGRPQAWRRSQVAKLWPPPASSPTLCDRLDGWQVECRGLAPTAARHTLRTSRHAASFVRRRTAGARRRGRPGQRLHARRQCQLSVHGQTHLADLPLPRLCKDGGPWECHERVAPRAWSRAKSLSGLQRSLRLHLEKPPGVGSLLVRQACRSSAASAFANAKTRGWR